MLTAEMLTTAVTNRDLEEVKKLLGENCPMEAKAVTMAANRGNLDILQELLKAGCPMEAQALTEAMGRLKILKLLLAAGCPIESQVLTSAIKLNMGYHFLVLDDLGSVKALLEAGCEVTKEHLYLAPSRKIKTVLAEAYKQQQVADLAAIGAGISGGHFVVKNEASPEQKRFLGIMRTLYESQDVGDVFANRAVGLPDDTIKDKQFNKAREKLFKKFGK